VRWGTPQIPPPPHTSPHTPQIWVKPHTRGLKPMYQLGLFSDAAKANTLLPVITPEGRDGSVSINADFAMYASLLGHGVTVTHDVAPTRRVYIHVPRMCGEGDFLTVNGVRLGPGDGLFVNGGPAHERVDRLTITATLAAGDAAAAVTAEGATTGSTGVGAGAGARAVEFLLMDLA
jgi:redox-sensitive bicupin YhaK (pirin superfamily)